MKLTRQNLDDIALEVAVRIETEYIIYEVFEDSRDAKMIGGTCYVAPPVKGDYYINPEHETSTDVFQVVGVAHPFRDNYAGCIYLKRVDKVTL
ncbi:hypothetical protein HZQ04_15845 [Elizabethkingia anophelis]|nr:hypothetical protein [Elizabethkingia anophelis]